MLGQNSAASASVSVLMCLAALNGSFIRAACCTVAGFTARKLHWCLRNIHFSGDHLTIREEGEKPIKFLPNGPHASKCPERKTKPCYSILSLHFILYYILVYIYIYIYISYIYFLVCCNDCGGPPGPNLGHPRPG